MFTDVVGGRSKIALVLSAVRTRKLWGGADNRGRGVLARHGWHATLFLNYGVYNTRQQHIRPHCTCLQGTTYKIPTLISSTWSVITTSWRFKGERLNCLPALEATKRYWGYFRVYFIYRVTTIDRDNTFHEYLQKYGWSIASRAVSLSWWSYRNSLSRKSRASGLTRWLFSLCMKRSHLFRECLQVKPLYSLTWST